MLARNGIRTLQIKQVTFLFWQLASFFSSSYHLTSISSHTSKCQRQTLRNSPKSRRNRLPFETEREKEKEPNMMKLFLTFLSPRIRIWLKWRAIRRQVRRMTRLDHLRRRESGRKQKTVKGTLGHWRRRGKESRVRIGRREGTRARAKTLVTKRGRKSGKSRQQQKVLGLGLLLRRLGSRKRT